MDPYPLKRRSDLHLARKAWHFGGVMLMVLVHHFATRDRSFQILAVATFLFVAADIVRQHAPALNKILVAAFGPLMREHERDGFAGTTYLLLGTFVILLVFPKTIVSLTLLFLAVADPLASLIGIRFGKDKLIGSKSLQGTMAAFIACTAISAAYFAATGAMTERILMVSLLAGLVGAVSELIPLGKLDDNFSFPLLASSLLWLLFNVFGGL